jgi:hypothetical protein
MPRGPGFGLQQMPFTSGCSKSPDNSPEIVRKHYAKWSPARQARIDELMEKRAR